MVFDLPRLNKSDRDASEEFAWPLEGAPQAPSRTLATSCLTPIRSPHPTLLRLKKQKSRSNRTSSSSSPMIRDMPIWVVSGSKENQTPVLDKLARRRNKFTSFYAQPVCGPSRSALLTGRYPARSKGWSMPASEITFAEMLKEVGYQTACVEMGRFES